MNPDLYSFLLHLHSVVRWVVLLLLLIAIFNSLTAGNRLFTRGDDDRMARPARTRAHFLAAQAVQKGTSGGATLSVYGHGGVFPG